VSHTLACPAWRAGKATVYMAAAGIAPSQLLPVTVVSVRSWAYTPIQSRLCCHGCTDTAGRACQLRPTPRACATCRMWAVKQTPSGMTPSTPGCRSGASGASSMTLWWTKPSARYKSGTDLGLGVISTCTLLRFSTVQGMDHVPNCCAVKKHSLTKGGDQSEAQFPDEVRTFEPTH
jgi:hypothetical protein